MKREEPTTCLVYTFVDEIGRVEGWWNGSSAVRRAYKLLAVFVLRQSCLSQTVLADFAFERIMELCVRHRTAVEPHVDEVVFASHRLSCVVYEYDVVHVRAVEVDAVVVFLTVIAHYEATFLERIALHNACCDCLLYLVVEFFYRTDALFVALIVAPDWQRRAPEARTA